MKLYNSVITKGIFTAILWGITYSYCWQIERTFRWSGNEIFPSPTLEIRNRDNYPLTITVINDGHEEKYELAANTGSFFESKVPVLRLNGLNLNKEVRVDIEFNSSKNPLQENRKFHNYHINPTNDPALSKTIFVSWENEGLRPQKGSLGQTQSKIPLKKIKNVTKEDLDSHKSWGRP